MNKNSHDALMGAELIFALMSKYGNPLSLSPEVTHLECTTDDTDITSVLICGTFCSANHDEAMKQFVEHINKLPEIDLIKKLAMPFCLGWNYDNGNDVNKQGYVIFNGPNSETVANFIEKPSIPFLELRSDGGLRNHLRGKGMTQAEFDKIADDAWESVYF